MVERYTIKDLPSHERPRERLESTGAASLSNPELIAILLRTGDSRSTAVELAGHLLAKFGSLENLASADVAALSSIKGIGAAKACQICAAFELGRRAGSHRDGRKPIIDSPSVIFDLLKNELSPLKQETFKVALLNTKNELIKIVDVTQGTLSGSLVHPRETFRAAVSEGCYSVILIHNHPSGDPSPSQDDIKITRTLVEAGKILGIHVLDHIIIGSDSFRSLKDAGIIG
ncbi:MAG TPA: DNA repair protein RadC [bacterium]|nr:DNA repair protein RadC [bacterium]